MPQTLKNMYLIVRVIVIILPFIGAIPVGVFWWLFDKMYDQIDDNEDLIRNVQNDLTAIQTALGESPQQIIKTAILLDDKRKEFERTADHLREASFDIVGLKTAINGLEDKITVLNNQMRTLEEEIRRIKDVDGSREKL